MPEPSTSPRDFRTAFGVRSGVHGEQHSEADVLAADASVPDFKPLLDLIDAQFVELVEAESPFGAGEGFEFVPVNGATPFAFAI